MTELSLNATFKLVRTPLNALLRGFKIIFLSLYAHITADECYAWFHSNAASPAARNTEQVNISKDIVHGRIRTTNTAWPPDYKSTVITTRRQLAWYEMELNVHEIYIFMIYRCINNMSVVFYFSLTLYNIWILIKTVRKYVHWSICKTIQMLYHGKAATFRCMYITSTIFRLSGISLIT